MSNSTSTLTEGKSGVSTAADNQAQTINNTTAADLRYITAEEYKVLRGIFDRFGIDDLEWCSEAVSNLTWLSFKEFFTTQPDIITHLNKTATDGENATTIRRFIRSLSNVNEHLSEVMECYEMLRNIACISKFIGEASIKI